MPPRAPEPEALDHTMFGSSGSGVANPLSPPPTVVHSERWMVPPPGLLLGTRNEAQSCLFPITLYGIASSTVTWYIWATGSSTRCQVSPRFTETARPPVVADDHAVPVVGIDPHVVLVSARPKKWIPLVDVGVPPSSVRASCEVRK